MQVRLQPQVQKEIKSELRTPDRLRENLDVVDIVIGFLSSGGGKPEKRLGEYVDKVLKMKKRPFSKKVNFIVEFMGLDSLIENCQNKYRHVSTVSFNMFYPCGKFFQWN